MTLWRTFAARLFVIATLSGVVVYVAMVILFGMAQLRIARDYDGAFVRAVFQRERTQCEAAPGAWWAPFPGDQGRLYAYDATTLVSPNPNAPPLDRRVYEKTRHGGDAFEYTADGGVFQTVVAETGPCALMQARWVKSDSYRRRYQWTQAIIAISTIVFIVLASAALVMRPLIVRVRRLARVAEDVGHPSYTGDKVLTNDELARVASALDRANLRIREQVEELSLHEARLENFLSDVAHDFKTPLASLRLGLEHLANHSAELSAEASDIVKTALSDVVYLAGLADNLRLAQKLKVGWRPADERNAVELREVVARVASRASVFARHRGIEVAEAVPDEPIFVQCNRFAAEQALSNLVENAIVHGDEGGHVSILLERRDEGFQLFVRDDGPGVAPKELPRLGERTFRSDEARQRHPAGSGLGLAIAHEVVRRCGWDIAWSSLKPRGLEVAILGPCAKDEPDAERDGKLD